jgi:hypothetical protein
MPFITLFTPELATPLQEDVITITFKTWIDLPIWICEKT